jgi:hypothetical protein
VKPQAEFICTLASRLGWQRREPGTGHGGGTVIVAKDGTRYAFTEHGDLNADAFRSLARKVVQHAEPVPSFATLQVMFNNVVTETKLPREYVRQIGRALGLNPPPKPVTIPTIDPGALSMDPEPAPRKLPGGNPVKAETVRDRPWMASGGKSKGTVKAYPSAAVIERTYVETGAVEYRCAWIGCDMTSGNPRTVASHYTHHTRGQGRQDQAVPIVVGHDADDRRQARIDRLAAELDAALGTFDLEMEGAASRLPEFLAEAVIDARIAKGHLEHVEVREPATVESLLQRIIDTANAARAIDPAAELRRDVDELRAEVADARLAADDARAKLAKTQDTLRALRDLTAEAAGDA